MLGKGCTAEQQDQHEALVRDNYKLDDSTVLSDEDNACLEEYDEGLADDIEDIEADLRQVVAFHHWALM